LEKRSKAELIEFIVEITRADLSVRQRVQSRFGLEASSKMLIADTRNAISTATDFDDRDLNSNFEYDSDAYQAVQRNFARLINMGKHAEVMELSVELMRDGSRQVEGSDEGIMAHEIEACLGVVIKALMRGIVPASGVVAWCDQMVRSDRVGFICDEELRALRKRFAQG
jgi:signal transduction histidine kinase